MHQLRITAGDDYRGLDEWLGNIAPKCVFLVCDPSLAFLTRFNRKLEELEGRYRIVRFSDFQPNPLYESVIRGVEAFREAGADAIMAVGGGSAMDVAKCIKLYAGMPPGSDYLRQPIVPKAIPFLAMPTTAGTGSEATQFAVIYRDGAKQSIADDSCIPSAVLLDPSCLDTLPAYQKKSTMMDALCHAVESFWSVNSTEESRGYSREAIRKVLANMEACLANEPDGNAGMLDAANLAGRAINITQTTAGHAMCYKLTSLFGIAHGHAAILCDRVLFPWMLEHTAQCIDPRGAGFLVDTAFRGISEAMQCPSPEAAAAKLDAIFRRLDLAVPAATETQFAELCATVNPVRLKNHPVGLAAADIDFLYRRILRAAEP